MNLNKQEKRYIDEESYKRIEKKIVGLTDKIDKLNLQIKDASDSETRKILLDSKKSLKVELTQLKKELNCFQVVNRQNNDNIVEIGDILRLKLIFSDDDIEEIVGKLVGNASVSADSRYEEVSVYGPVGSAIYGKNIGDTIFVKEKSFCVEIMEKLIFEQEKNSTISKGYRRELKNNK